MRIRSSSKTFVLVALLLWLMSSWMGVHEHRCLDGQEPLSSLHMDVMGGHQVHSPSESHQDFDVEASQSVLAKFFKLDPSMPLLLAVIFILLVSPQTPLFFFYTVAHSLRRCVGLRPPLRAPPATSC